MHNKTFQSLTAPQRIVVKPNLNHERQDTTSSDARTSFDHSDKHGGTYRETCRGEMDFKIRQLSKNTITSAKKKTVQKLIHQFEDLQQKSAFNPFSEKSKEMINGKGNMEYFEICEITLNIPCHNCMTHWTKGIVYCTYGTCLRPSDKIRKLNKDRHDVLSIPNYVT